MNRITKSLLVLFGFLILGATMAASVSNGQGPPERPRKFYLTRTEHNGAQALSACAAGYHMASMWEIYDLSDLRYETGLGLTLGDSGFGPPAGVLGWIRTGNAASGEGLYPSGEGNCIAYTSAEKHDSGTVVQLSKTWSVPVQVPSWSADVNECPNSRPVWCVKD